MRKHSLYSFLWYSVNGFAVVSLCTLAFGLIWDYSEQRYLKGFADAVVPASGSPEQKAESILGWMQSGPTRRTSTSASGILADREPEQTLNYSALLRACGSATNAFINLATSAGLRARRLLLLGEDDRTKHVVAEVWLGARWVVVDPAYRTLLRDREGRFLTKEELRDASVLREATRGIPGYDSSYTFERTASIRLARVPYLGPLVGNILERILPEWEDMLNWSFVVQRRSLTFTYFASLVFFLSIVLRFSLGWYGRKRLGILRVPLQENMSPPGATLPESAR